MQVIQRFVLALTVLAATGCATTMPTIDKAKFADARTVTVATPAPSNYPAAVGSISGATGHLGLLGAVVGGFIDGTHASKPLGSTPSSRQPWPTRI